MPKQQSDQDECPGTDTNLSLKTDDLRCAPFNWQSGINPCFSATLNDYALVETLIGERLRRFCRT